MRPPSFLEGVALALAASIAGSILFTVLAPLFSGATVLRLLIAVIGFGYLIYLLRRSPERIGRISALAVWVVAAGAVWLAQPPLVLYLIIHLGLIWVIRSLYFYGSVLSSLADLGLTGLSLAAAIWSATHTGSLFLSLWCFFLMQALFVAIPHDLRTRANGTRSAPDSEDRFQRAHRVAQAALRKLSSTH
ncbi:hypothetical protein [Thiogranum longum]